MKQMLWGTQHHSRLHLQRSSPNSSLSTCLGGNITSPSEWSPCAIEVYASSSVCVPTSSASWEFSTSLEVVQHEGDPSCFKVGLAVVNALLKAG